MSVDLLVKRTACPVCKHRVSFTKKGQIRVHGPRRPDGGVCHGSNGVIGYRYRVVDSSVDKVPIGTNLIYSDYRGEVDQQDVFSRVEMGVSGGWVMEFLDMGVKLDGTWYDLDGNTERQGRDSTT